MPVFKDELITNPTVKGDPYLKPELGSPITGPMPGPIDTGFSMGDEGRSRVGLSGDELAKMAKAAAGEGGGANLIPLSETVANKRYNTYTRGMDLENVYGLSQSWYDQLGNGIAKFAATGVGTFAQSFATIPNTVSAIKNGKMSDLSGVTGYESAIDDWLKNVEDIFPNYITREERAHPFRGIIPFMPGSANFWGDKIIKNLGFTAGAIGGALAQDAIIGVATEGIGAVPLLASQIGKASLWLNKVFTGTNRLDKVLDIARTVGKTEQQILNIKKLGEAAAYTKVADGFRYATSLYGASRTEAAVESRDAYRQVKESLINEHKRLSGGKEPEGADLAEIESYAEDAMNTRFGVNMALLTASNAIQFDNLFRSFTSGSKKGIVGQFTKDVEEAGKIGLVEGSLDKFEKKAAEGIAGKIWESIRPKLPNILSEGVYEEGGQYAAERGTYDYYTRKYKNLNNPDYKATWDAVSETLESTVKGMKDQFGTTEGIENMVIGTLSAVVSGGIMGKIDSVKGKGKEARLQTAINVLNQYGLTGVLSNKFSDTLQSANIAKEMQDAVKSGNVYRYKNLKDDLFFGFVNSRIPSGMHDVTIEQLNMLKDLDKEEFEKTFGMDFNSSNKSTVNEYVDSLIGHANHIKSVYDSIDSTFKNPFSQNTEDAETLMKYNMFESWKTDLTYYGSRAYDLNDRLNSIQQSLTKINGALTNDAVAQLTDKDSLRDLSKMYEERANQLAKTITDFTTPADARNIKNQIKALRTASEKINIGLSSNVDEKLFDYLLNFELNNQDPTKDRVVGQERSAELFTYGVDINKINYQKRRASEILDDLSSKDGFDKYFKQGEEMASGNVPEREEEQAPPPPPAGISDIQFTNKAGEKEFIRPGREYEVPATKLARVDKIADDRYQVTAPDGTITFYSTEQAAKEAADDINQEFGNLKKVKVVAINPDGTIKVEDVNGDIYNIDPKRLEGYEKIESEQEKLQKLKEQVDTEQAEIESMSGTPIEDPDPLDISVSEIIALMNFFENSKKAVEWLFTSTTSVSEDWEKSAQDVQKPHIQRAITMLNNIKTFPNKGKIKLMLVTQKNEASLGLSGLTNLQFAGTGVPESEWASVDNGLVAAVYVEHDGADVYLVDVNGKRLNKVNAANQADLNSVVFATMPTTAITWSNGESRYRDYDKDKIAEYSKRWRAAREKIFAMPQGEMSLFGFSISNGIPSISDVNATNPIGKTIISEDKIPTQQGLVVINENGIISHQGSSYKLPRGYAFIQYGDILQYVPNKLFTTNQEKAITEVLKLMSAEIADQLAKGKKIKLNRNYTEFLQGVMYWKEVAEGKKPLKNQMYIDTKTMDLIIGDKRYDITNLAGSEAEILAQLSNTYMHINNNFLKENFNQKYKEYYVEGGELKNRVWDNYQTYLLASKYPDGSNRSGNEIPLTTSVNEKTGAVPFNYKQKYAILHGIELPALSTPAKKEEEQKPPTPPEEKPTPTVKVGKYTVDGKTMNTFEFGVGQVAFTVTIDNNGEFTVTIDKEASVEAINKALASPAVMKTVTDTLNALNVKLDATDKSNDVAAFMSYRIITELKSIQKQEAATKKETYKGINVVESDITTQTGEVGAAQYDRATNTIKLNRKVLREKFAEKAWTKPRKQKDGSFAKALPENIFKTYEEFEKFVIEHEYQHSLLSKEDFVKQNVKATSIGEYEDEINRRALKELNLEVPSSGIKTVEDIKRYFFNKNPGLFGGDLNAALTMSNWEIVSNTLSKNATQEELNMLEVVNGRLDISALQPTAPVSDIDAKKADIERRRQENLKDTGDIFDYVSKQPRTDGRFNAFYTATKESAIFDSYQEAVDWINSKYDAELAALEGPKPPAGKKNFKNTKGPGDSEYRRVGVGGVRRMTEAEYQLFKEWHAKNVPNIPFEVLDRIITTYDGEKAWGVFENGVAKFYKSAARGTEYHEIFEGIWAAFLTDEERAGLLNEFKSKKGTFTDRASGKKIAYADATDKQAKERIADDFSDFRLGKLPARSIGERILKFFKDIIEFFKSFIKKPSLKEDLFKSIDTGKYKKFTIPEDVKSMAPEYRAAEGLTEQQTNDFVEDMSVRFFQNIFATNTSMFDRDVVDSRAIFNQIKEAYSQKEVGEESKMDLLGETTWNELVRKTKDFLRTFKLEFDEDGVVYANDEERDQHSYAAEPFSKDWKKYSPFAIKVLIASLPKTVAMNQMNSTSFELPNADVESSSVNGYKLLNFSRTFATLLNKFKNTINVNNLVEKLKELAKLDSNYVRLFTRLGGDRSTMNINFDNFEYDDWRLFVNFYQTFTKQKPDAVIQYVSSAGEVYTSAANVFSDIERIASQWMTNLRNLSKKEGSIITYDSVNKVYLVGDVSGYDITKPEGRIGLLNALGIPITIEFYTSLRTEGGDKSPKEQFDKAVANIHAYIGKENKQILSVLGETLGVKGQISKIAEIFIDTTNPNLDTTHFGVEGKRMQAYAESNVPSVFESEFNSSETLDELLQKRPEYADVFSKNSIVLKKGGLFFNREGRRIRDIKVGYVDGQKDLGEGKNTKTSKFTLGTRFITEINQNLNGDYYVIIPGDGQTEWKINLGNYVTFKDVDTGDVWDVVNNLFKNYLRDEFALAKSDRSYLMNTSPRAKQLRFLKDILPQTLVDEAHRMIIDGDATVEQIEKFISDNNEEINNAIKDYFTGLVDETKNVLFENGELVYSGTDTLDLLYIDSNFMASNKLTSGKLTVEELDNILNFVNINYAINNIEMHKILYGDPYQFKIKGDILDEVKRIKSSLSPRRITFDSPEFNTFLNQDMNKAGDIQLENEPFEAHEFKSFTKTVTLNDVTVAGSLSNKIAAYEDTNEADAAAWIELDTYREVKIKNGQWDMKTAEPWYQWQKAYTRNKLAQKGVYTYKNEALREQDAKLITKPEPEYILNVLKPIVTGIKHNNRGTMAFVLDKMSQMPIYYKAMENTHLEDLYVKMVKEKIGYAVMVSGRKVGAEGVHDLYKAGKFNQDAFTSVIGVPWKAYGIQVETSFDKPKEQTRGSQITKLVSIDLFDNGEPVGATPERKEVVRKAYERNVRILDQMHENAYNEFLKKMGLEDNGTSFKVADYKALSETLEYEMLRRELSDNGIETVRLNKNRQFPIPFEASTAYVQIRNIILSVVDKSLLSPKMSGGSYVQVPVTMWEKSGSTRGLAIKEYFNDSGKKITKEEYNELPKNMKSTKWRKISSKEYEALSEEQKKSVALTDDTLKFYSENDRYCEVMLPHWFKVKFGKKFANDEALLKYLNNTEEGKSILRGIGFRIPTQGMSSIEAFRVKGFLDKSMGMTVVVPSEITMKAGSDFDIDKLNMYLKATYIDVNGDIKLVRYRGSEEATKEFYKNVFNAKFDKKVANKEDLREAARIMTFGDEDPKNLIERYSETLDRMMEGYQEGIELIDALDKELDKLSNENLQNVLREEFINDMYKKSLQNEYYDSMEELVTLPENFDRLVAPITDSGLKDEADLITKLETGSSKGDIKPSLINRNFLTRMRHAFITAKRWVGIVAVNITGHSLTQKSKVYIDPARIENVPKADQAILGTGIVRIPHNTVTVDGKTYVSMSGTKTFDGKQYISDRLSGYATATVDVVKDPYLLKLIKSDLAVGTVMFLERIGAGKYVSLFMNQPIITDYLKMLDGKKERGLFKSTNIDLIQGEYMTTEKDFKAAKIDFNKLADNIELYRDGNQTQESNAVQIKILLEFLKYAKMAEYSFKLTQASNYDTSAISSGDDFRRKLGRTRKAREENIFSSVDKILDNSFLGKQANLLDRTMESLGEFFKTERASIRYLRDAILQPFAENDYFSKEKFDKLSLKVTTALVDFLIQSKTGITDYINELLVDPATSIGAQLAEAKQKFPDNQLLQDLEITDSGRGIGATKSVKLSVNLRGSAYDENLYTGMMRELRDNPETNQLYNNLIKISIIQGTQQSAISIRNIIPLEDFSAIAAPVIDNLVVTSDLDIFAEGMFARNNWKDKDFWYQHTPKFFEIEDPAAPVYNQYGEEIPQYFSPNFIVPKEIKEKKVDRGVMLVPAKYSPVTITRDYLIVPRVVSIDKAGTERVDMKTGLYVSNANFAARKAKGDMSLKDVYGYQKVRLATGEPLIIDDERNGPTYVYKLINLYGDGQYATEYYDTFRETQLNNGTVRVPEEINDDLIVDAFKDRIITDNLEEGIQIREPIPAASAITSEGAVIQTSAEKINIYAGTGENAELSNFAVRPFVYKVGGLDESQWVAQGKFNTVEGAFQAQKIEYASNATEEEAKFNLSLLNKLRTASGAEAKSLGRQIKGLYLKDWNADSSGIMKTLLLESFKQNPEALAKLLATGNATLTHTQDTGKWGTEFPRLLMEVREELRGGQVAISEETPEFKGNIFEARNVQIDYTSGQKKALSDIENLIRENKNAYYLLAGYAGTGKTTIAENIARFAMSMGRKATVLAPTNKAAKVLNDKLNAAGVATAAATIHRAVYGEPDLETGEWIRSAIFKNELIIVDESSMIAKEVMKDLIEATREGNNIVVFMGDSFQLEPVGEDSGLFKAPANPEQFKKDYGVGLIGNTELTEVKRQSLDSNVLKLATITRNDNKAYIPSKSIADFKVATSRQEFINDFKASIKNKENSVMIVATNNERLTMNKIARVEKFGAESQNVINDKETIISVANSTDVLNSELFDVETVRSVEGPYPLTFQFGQASATYEMHIVKYVAKDGIERTMFLFPGMDKASLYPAQILKAIRESNPELFDKLDNDGHILRNRKSIKLKSKIVVGTYGYAITAHKSQGSQWEKVFVNQNYVAPTWNGSRWYYTAITRSSKDVIVLPSSANTMINEADLNKKVDEIVVPDYTVAPTETQTTMSDEEIRNSEEYRKWLEKNDVPWLTDEQLLEHYKKCG